MNKTLGLFLFLLAIIGCSSGSRKPAGQETPFSFQLSGENDKARPGYSFHLLSLDRFAEGQAHFKEFLFSDSESALAVRDWQNQFQQNLKKLTSDQKIKIYFGPLYAELKKEELENIDRVLELIDQTPEGESLKLQKKIEIIEAFNENFRPPEQLRFGPVSGAGKVMAMMTGYSFDIIAPKEISVEASSYWKPQDPENLNLYDGPGKLNSVDLKNIVSDVICSYAGSKKSYGVHAGFKVQCAGTKLKIKFGNEILSGPFNSRIYHRLGYNVPAIHPVRGLKVKYDRHIFSEINQRKSIPYEVDIFHHKLIKHEGQKFFNGTEFVQEAVLNSGERLSAQGFKRRLLKVCGASTCDYSDKNVHEDFENQLDYLVMIPATVTEKIDGEELGPWSYSAVDHPDRPEIGSLMILGAWSGNFDLRTKNNGLFWNSKKNEMLHFISDPGSGLGESFQIHKQSSVVAAMSWKLTYPTEVQELLGSKRVMNISYSALENNEAFRRVGYNEARWMAKNIAGLSEHEISEALAGADPSAAEFLLAREKLLSMQKFMIRDFNLKEFPPVRQINKTLNFNPLKDKVEVKLKDGRVILLENRGDSLRRGSLHKK